jgi:hypothetical protein
MSKIKFPVDQSVVDMVKVFRLAEFQMACALQEVYIDLMRRELPQKLDGTFVYQRIACADEIADKVPAKPGLYVILSSYSAGSNECSFHCDGLTAVYRGHAYNMRERLQSHLDNKHYRYRKETAGQGYWKECMKLGELFEDRAGGINIGAAELQGIGWGVLSLQLPGSSVFMREQAEYAFDHVFGKPIGSIGEKKIAPSAPAGYEDHDGCVLSGSVAIETDGTGAATSVSRPAAGC